MSFFKGEDVSVVSLVDWLDWASGRKHDVFIALPMIQRGFVWKPVQIIDLWDSLFQGMPIGSMMATELPEGTPVRRPNAWERSEREAVPSRGGLGLIDGQQRTLAMLAAWPLATNVPLARRLWVDFADDPPQGQLLRLRVTTSNQPFGFQLANPSSKLSLSDRRKAREQFHAATALPEQQEPELATACPFSHDPGLPIDLRWLLHLWEGCRGNLERRNDKVLKHLQDIQSAKFDRSSERWSRVRSWDSIGEDRQRKARARIQILGKALDRVFLAKMPITRVDAGFFEITTTERGDPPLAILFKRIGTGGTQLSNADYVYSVIKHVRPEAYDLVEDLCAKKNVASLLTPTDLVMTAVRLAAATWQPDDGKVVPDMESPDKRAFHRLLERGDFIKGQFIPLVDRQGKIAGLFDAIQTTLQFRGDGDTGLPKQAFPLLNRPLVQVLLFMAHIGYVQDQACRHDVMLLVMFWLVAVSNPSKASLLAYEVIRLYTKKSGNTLGKAIHDRIIEGRAAVRLFAPSEIENRPGLAISDEHTTLIRGESRFNATARNDEAHETTYRFYRNHWWQPWTHCHPLLLWLQREMVADQLDHVDPAAGTDEDTPYDYDHILPQAHWGGWTGCKPGKRLIDFAEDHQAWVVGNAIGNVRVWGSSLNRSDGDACPNVKLALQGETAESQLLLRASQIDREQAEDWRLASCQEGAQSCQEGNHRHWSRDRALAFQRAVEKRTFDLYRRYYKDLGFPEWYDAR